MKENRLQQGLDNIPAKELHAVIPNMKSPKNETANLSPGIN